MNTSFELLEFPRLLESCAAEAASELGRRRVLESQPLGDVDRVREQLDLVAEMVQLLGETSLPLQGISDISTSLIKLKPAGATLEREEFFPLRDLLEASSRVRKFFDQQRLGYPKLLLLSSGLSNFDDLVAAIDRIFDPDGSVRDGASPELRRLRRQREAENRRLHETLESVLRQWQKQRYAQEDELTLREGKLLIPVKTEHRGRVAGVIQDESASGATVFVEPLEAIHIGNAIRKLENEERREIQRILLELCDKLHGKLRDMKTSLETLAQFDHVYARARFSRRLRCRAPEVRSEAYLNLVEARHPLLVLKSGVQTVPSSLELGGEAGAILIITGPNAGGKTVALKTVGLFCLMAACGLHVPAAEGTQLPLLSALHCDIGDPQSLDQDLSTFTSHLQRLKAALEDQCSPKLVLLDEIGASTDPAEGSALARAALLELLQQGALGVVTTHQGTLKAFAHDTEGIFNGSMEFDQETLRPTFRFRAGIPGSSYALQISARLGFPESIIQTAQQFLGEQTSRLEDLLAQLNESLRLSETARRAAEIKLTEQQALAKLYSERLQELHKSEKEQLRKAAEKAKELLDDANRRIETAVKEIRESQAQRSAIKQAHATIRQEKQKVHEVLKPVASQKLEVETPAFRVGAWVKLEGLKDAVQVQALRREGQEAKLEVGGVHLWMDVSRLTLQDAPKSLHDQKAVRVSVSELSESSLRYELDLRGMTGDEAIFAVEKYLSDCVISGWKSVRIIHGKGTGVLRTKVRELLEGYPGVKSFRYGRPEEGEYGVTIVELE